MVMVFDVLSNNGFRYEYVGQIEAPTVYAARLLWKRRGDSLSDDFKVRYPVKREGVSTRV